MTPVQHPTGDLAAPRFQVRQCTREGCRLRFTILLGDRKGERCPLCRAETEALEISYERFAIDQPAGRSAGPELEVLLDNIRSAWNVGSMLRTADGAGVRHVHLCGVSSTPDNPKVAKTALGAEKSLPWSFHHDGAAAARALKEQGLRLWALEGGPRAESLFELSSELPGAPLALVAGNELSGVDPGILDLCERVVCLPMQGIKGSLNVAVAFGIAVYTIRFGAQRGSA
jgi:tRNA G18 (ribose-2'-O)-methylase SpoU